MNEGTRPSTSEDPRNRLAAERTLLAWIRTGITVMGFGFVVARFGFFLTAMKGTTDASTVPHSTISTWIGVILIIVGVVMNLAAALEHRRFLRRLVQQQPYLPPRVSLSLVAAVALSLLGLLLGVYLLTSGR
jgi:putative membrane protein